MHEISLTNEDWLDLSDDGDGGSHAHQHVHAHPDGSLSGAMHTHNHGAGHQHQHNALGPQGFGSGGDAGELANLGAAVELGGYDPLHNATAEEEQILADVLAEQAEEDGWSMTGADGLADEIASLPDDELEALAAEGAMAPGSPFAAWMNRLSDAEFSNIRAEGRLFGSHGGELDYLAEAYQLDQALADTSQRQAVRLAEDRDGAASRRGPHHRRPSDELILSNALGRFARGTYTEDQLVDLAADWSGADPFADTQFGTSTASPEDIRRELAYQVRGGLAPGRSRRQPLPPVGGLARTIGLR